MFFEESVDFINMHYVKNEKDTPPNDCNENSDSASAFPPIRAT